MLLSSVISIKPPYLEAAEDLLDNPEQWSVYESKGNCVVLAGPGSGKTKTVTVKLAKILCEDVLPPRGVACVTYNNECAREVKRRLSKLGVIEDERVFIGTVHSFCLQNVVIPFGRLAGLLLPDPLRVASESEQERLFQEALDEVGISEPPAEWRTRADRYRRTFLDRKSEQWATDEGLAELIETYERLLRGENLIDFDDIMLVALGLIEREEWIRQAIRARFPVLVVDEYQDLGIPLHRIVLSLCMKSGVRLLAVGDPDQSIYGFTGAKPELLNELAEQEGVKRIRLQFNYRCGATIIRASEAALGEERGYKPKGSGVGTVDFYECPGGLIEQTELICDRLIPEAMLRREGRSLGDIAVLYADRHDGDFIASAVEAHGMHYVRIDRGALYKKTPLTRWLEDCAKWCAGGWTIAEPAFSELLWTWLSMNRSITTKAERHELVVKFRHFLFANRSPEVSLSNWLLGFHEACLGETLQREPILQDESESLDELIKVTNSGEKLSSLTVASFAGQGGSREHLNLFTLHSAKGLEFDIVIMMGMDQGRIPRWNARSDTAKREARRVFYVGLTRARHEVHMTYSGWTENRFGRRFNDGPSEFLLEVQERLRWENEDTPASE